MNKILAIKGDRHRGNEVIALLQMLGGETGLAKGYDETAIYVIPVNGIIDVRFAYEKRIENYAVFTLDEFYARFPFKVGDFVFADNWSYAADIREMRWNPNTQEVEYMVKPGTSELWYTANKLIRYSLPKFKVGETVYNRHTCKLSEIAKYQWQKDEYIYFMENAWYSEKQLTKNVEPVDNGNKMKNVLAELLEHIKNTSKEDLEKEFEELKEWSNVGPTVEEFMDFCNKVNKKPKYPTTYEECCKNVFGLAHGGMTVDVPMHYSPLIIDFAKLLICRDAYWKIAGEQMGLDGPWKPDWNEANDCIINWNGEIKCEPIVFKNVILAFPTEEIRDTFYKNFKDLIEKCKELL